ncbi:PDZ domain-containing protein [Propioniciclava coleopterorum]|uniref:PDZ domain-containing protein n=1 Tax=Propioniciclava coleopterorum TaxID=2714937 RepID=A0A6G7Y5B5_9ACTN|nr:trypsin-like peptidase domain-containing protein [Propioniciclava coleopterorum]QIK71807.1 PDZ domain-containing protein [Propioniciclava coleopterorum]
MKTTTSLTALALAGATALALAVPTLAPRLADRLTPALQAPVSGVLIPARTGGSASDPGTGASSGAASESGVAGSSGSGVAGPSDPTYPGSAASASAGPTSPTAAQSKGIVLITTRVGSGEAAGTGMVLTPDGQVLTNYHVVQGSTQVEVEVADTGRTYAATVVGHDATRDVALLQLKDASGLATITPDADQVAVGQSLTAVGNASGGGSLVAAPGSVTALNQQVTVNNDNGGTETLTGVIATDAGAVPGDSGGPMFDAQGEVLGMTTAGSQTVTRSPRGTAQGTATTTTSYAVPIADALSVVQQIRTGRESGSVQVGARAYLGVSVLPTPALTVASVVSGGPAAEAGITVGSIITSLQGTRVASQDDLSGILDGLDPGAKATVTWVDADGAQHRATLTLGASPVN